jgi:hypothetical protein
MLLSFEVHGMHPTPERPALKFRYDNDTNTNLDRSYQALMHLMRILASYAMVNFPEDSCLGEAKPHGSFRPH